MDRFARRNCPRRIIALGLYGRLLVVGMGLLEQLRLWGSLELAARLLEGAWMLAWGLVLELLLRLSMLLLNLRAPIVVMC